MMDMHHRFPWSAAEDALLIRAKAKRRRHKDIARALQRTPRAVDQRVHRLNKLQQHRNEELALLKKVVREAKMRSDLA